MREEEDSQSEKKKQVDETKKKKNIVDGDLASFVSSLNKLSTRKARRSLFLDVYESSPVCSTLWMRFLIKLSDSPRP